MSPGMGAMPCPAGSGGRGLGSGRHCSPHPHPGKGTQGQSVPALPAREGLALTGANADAWGCWDWATQPLEAWRRAGHWIRLNGPAQVCQESGKPSKMDKSWECQTVGERGQRGQGGLEWLAQGVDFAVLW